MSSRNQPQTAKILWLAFVFVTLVAFFFRFYRLANHPLGLFFDPAINGLDALRLMQRGGHVLFFPTNGGRESLFIYLLIPFIQLFNSTPLSIRALTATISLLNVVLLFAFIRSQGRQETGDRRGERGEGRLETGERRQETGEGKLETGTRNPHFWRWLAVLGSLLLAVSYWHIVITRLGQRPVLVPMLSVPLFWFFLKGWHNGQKRWFILSGVFMGLEGYSYSAARLLPVILVLALLPEFWLSDKKRLGKRFSQLLIFGITALVVYLPMAWYLLAHPAQFTARAGSVMVWNFLDTPSAVIAEIGRNGLRVLGFFCCAGSPNPIFGLPNYPGLPLLLTPFLLIGLGVALKYWRLFFFRLVVVWWLVGVFAAVVAIEAPHPLRMIVALVPTPILVALGLITFFNWLNTRFMFQIAGVKFHPLWFSFPLIFITLPGMFRAYFVDWTALQSTQGAYDYGAVAIRDTILEQADTETAIYLPLTRFNDSTLLYYLGGSFQRQAALSASPAAHALVISPEGYEQDTTWVRLQNQTTTVLPPLTAEGRQLIQSALNKNPTPIQTITGETAARIAPLTTDLTPFLQQPTLSLTAIFGPVQLTSAHYESILDPTGNGFPVTLYWQANQPMKSEYEILLRLVDDQQQAWGNGDARPTDWVYPTSFWRPKLDHIAAQQEVILQAESLPPGRYWLALSLFDPVAGQRLPLTAANSDSPDTFFIGPLKVPLPLLPAAELNANYAPVTFGDVATLSDFIVEPLPALPGESLHLTLLWETLTPPPLDYTVFVHLLNANNEIVTGHDSQPVTGTYPTSIWSPGERILDPHTLPLPPDLPPGTYRLAIGLYHQPTGIRLPLHFTDGQQDTAGRLVLPQLVEVK